MSQKTSLFISRQDLVSDQISFRFLEAAHHNMNQQCVFLKSTNFQWTFDVNIVHGFYSL